MKRSRKPIVAVPLVASVVDAAAVATTASGSLTRIIANRLASPGNHAGSVASEIVAGPEIQPVPWRWLGGGQSDAGRRGGAPEMSGPGKSRWVCVSKAV